MPVDFCEIPSHLMEHFVWDRTMLTKFARYAEPQNCFCILLSVHCRELGGRDNRRNGGEKNVRQAPQGNRRRKKNRNNPVLTSS